MIEFLSPPWICVVETLTPNTGEWSNVLNLSELLYLLPALNGKLGNVFYTHGTIKVDKRLRLTNQSLDDLLLFRSDQVQLVKP